MHALYYWCLVILLWKSIISPTLAIGRTCISSHHRFTTNQQTYEILNRKNFTPQNSAANFLPMIYDEKGSRLIIGAKDYVFYVNDTSLEELEALYWRSDQQRISSCLKHQSTPDVYCANYVHFLAIYQDKLFACGTNSLVPKYKIMTLKNLTNSKEKISYEICSMRPDYAVVGDITYLGELISGSYRDYAKNPVITGTFIFNDHRKRKIKEQGDKNHEFMNQPEFVSSISAGDSVYIFIMEKAIENNDKRTSTVVRLCIGDNGGPRLKPEMWTTFRKSRLVCVIDRNNERYHFKNLVDVVYDKDQDVFYASYTMYKQLNMYSAVCTFLRRDVDETFSGSFLETNPKLRYLQPVSNGNFLNGCKVNPSNLTKPGNAVDGKQPTNHLDVQSLTKATSYSLMERKVHHTPDVFEFMQPGSSFTRLALYSVALNDGTYSSVPMLFIATESGSVLMVYKYRDAVPCIINEIFTDIGKIHRILFNKKKSLLYASSGNNVISLDINYCHVFKSEEECIKAHNPLCGWSTLRKQCLASWSAKDLKNDLSKCPKSSNFFGPWSNWSACEYSPQRYCYCRSRSCISCNTSLCNNGDLTEVKDCAVNPVIDLDDWLVNGAVDGKWSDWLPWSACSLGKCGNFTMTRIRTCTSPLPVNGGRKCEGDSFQCKSCPKMPTVREAITIWSGWGSWGECVQVKGAYLMNSTRKCSKPNSCIGSSIKKLPCTPKGNVEWGEWSSCSCAQRVRHRLPIIINGCDNCSALTYPQYEICDCPTTTTEKITTSPPVTTGKICTPAPSTAGPVATKSESTDSTKLSMVKRNTTSSPFVLVPTIVSSTNIITKAQKDPQCNPENQFSLKQLIIIITIVIVTCFLMFGLIIYLILRRKHNEKVHLNGRTKSSDHTPLRNFNPVET